MTKIFLLSQFLRKIDIFGVGISFRINEDSKFKTRFGGFISLVICFLLIFMFSESLQQIIYKTNPSVISEERILPNPTRSDLNKKNFSFVMSMIDSVLQNPVADESIFRLEATFLYKDTSVKNGEQLYKFKNMELERCNENSFQVEGTQDYFLKLNYANMYCFSNFNDYYLVGQFEMDQFSVIQVNVISCDENDPNNQVICMDKKERDVIIQRSYLQIYYSTQVVEVSNYNKPFQNIGISSFWSLNLDYMNSVSMLYQKTHIQDDNGLFTSNIQKQQSLLYSSQNSQLQGKTGFSVMQISLYLEKNKEMYYTRQYMKIPQAFSQIGGLFNFLFALGCLLSQPYSQMQLNRTLFNSAFYINKEGEENHSQKKQKDDKTKNNSNLDSSPKNDSDNFSKNKSLLDASPQLKEIKQDISNSLKGNSFQLNRNNTQQQIIKQSPQKNKNREISDKCQNIFQVSQNNENNQNQLGTFKNKLYDIKVKTAEYFSYYFNCFNVFKQNEISKIIHLGTQKIQNYTDVCFIVNKLIEFEKLKTLVLNDQQQKLFNFIPKPQLDSQFLAQEQLNEKFNSQNNNAQSPQNLQQSKQEENILESDNQDMVIENLQDKHKKNKFKSQFNILNIDNKSNIQKAKEAQLAFNLIYKNHNKKSKIDLKLIEMLDQNLISLFQKNIFDPEQDQNLLGNLNQTAQNKILKDNLNNSGDKNQNQKEQYFKSKTLLLSKTQFQKSVFQEYQMDGDRDETDILETNESPFQIYKPYPKSFIQSIQNS